MTGHSEAILVEVVDDVPSNSRMAVEWRKGESGVAVYAELFAADCFRAMELITILNRCHPFEGFVYQHARFGRRQVDCEG